MVVKNEFDRLEENKTFEEKLIIVSTNQQDLTVKVGRNRLNRSDHRRSFVNWPMEKENFRSRAVAQRSLLRNR